MPTEPAGGESPEMLCVFRKTNRFWFCELRNRTHGFEVLISADGLPLIRRTFQSRQQAVAWAHAERYDIECGASS